MSEIVLRLAILVLVVVFTIVLVMYIQRFIQERRQRALNAEPLPNLDMISRIDVSTGGDASRVETKGLAHVRILAFSSEDCSQCRVLQAPVLRRVVEAKGADIVSVIDIDAPSTPALTQRYHVLTVPTTVLLDTTGKAHAVNYGFTNAQSLLKQVDEILAAEGAQEALP